MRKSPHQAGFLISMERETGFEPATSTLARSHSTAELLPLRQHDYKRYGYRGQANLAAELWLRAALFWRLCRRFVGCCVIDLNGRYWTFCQTIFQRATNGSSFSTSL